MVMIGNWACKISCFPSYLCRTQRHAETFNAITYGEGGGRRAAPAKLLQLQDVARFKRQRGGGGHSKQQQMMISR